MPYKSREDTLACKIRYNQSPKGKAAFKRYQQTDQYKQTKAAQEAHRLALRKMGDEQLYLHTAWKCTKDRARRDNIINEFDTFKQFWNLWVRQKQKHGYRCPYSGQQMTFIYWNFDSGFARPATNISVDQIVPRLGYTRAIGRRKSNVILCTWGANVAKNNLTPDVMRNILDVYDNGIKDLSMQPHELGPVKLRKQMIIDPASFIKEDV